MLAAEKAKLKNYNVSTYPEKEDFFTRFMKDFQTSAETKMMKKQLGDNYMIWKQIQSAQKMNGIYALIQFDVDFN